MAPMWHLGVASLCRVLYALVLMMTEASSQSIAPRYISEAPRPSCTDIHHKAFGNDTLKPGVCYLVSEKNDVFLDARAFCQGLGDNLGWDVADIEDAVEQQLIHDAIDAMKTNGSLYLKNSNRFWIGQNDMKTENVWRYLNDSFNKCNPTVYLDWGSYEPNGGRRKNCVSYDSDGDYFMDLKCDGQISYLCKVKITLDTVPFCPDFTEETSTEAPDECVNILTDAFGNPSTVPGVCYFSDSDQSRTFEEALGFCQSLPGGNWSVPDIEDADENLFLEVWNRDNFPKNNGYWIGQTDREREGDFRYTSSGQCPVYLNWESSQPNGLRSENCLAMFKQNSGAFSDKECSGTARYYTLCKLKTDSKQTGGSPTSCNKNILSTETTACSRLRTDAFGRVDKPGLCYFMTGQYRDWLSAVDLCNDEGWSLIDIEDATENEMLTARHRNFAPSGRCYWVGQNDREVEGTWKYSSNDMPSDAGVFLDWKTGEPNGGDSEGCISMDKSGGWRDKDCSISNCYATCKKRIECVDILPDAFGNPSVPGVCYASDRDQKRTFEEALSFCQSLPGGNWLVADIEDADENLFLLSWNTDNFPYNNGYWIGQNDREQEGDVRYTSSGQCPVYLNWESSQPNGLRSENCLAMFKQNSGAFSDKECSGTARYYTLCKLKTGSNQTGGSPTSCNKNILSTETAACSSLRADAFGRVDKPGLCYFMTGQYCDWLSAVDLCKNEGWSLIDIEDATENEMLTARHRNFAPSGRFYWVGQNDREVEGTWKYSSNDTPSDAGVFLNWKTDEPSSVGDLQDCILMDKSGGWWDKKCSVSNFYVTCKKRIAIPITRATRFAFVSSDATCNPQDALAPSYQAKSRMQCAKKCLRRRDCQAFGFVDAGKEDACMLCRGVRGGLQFKAGSRYYSGTL